MGILGGWVVRLTAAAIAAALAEKLMPPGPIRQVGRIVCGLMVLAVLLRPLSLRSGSRSTERGRGEQAEGQLRAELDLRRGEVMKPIIEQRFSAYISDKAAELGIPCEIRVFCAAGEEGVWLPHSARLCTELTDREYGKVSELVVSELGIAAEMLTAGGGE